MKSQQVLFIGLVWPESKSSAAGWRIIQLIEWFTAHHFSVTFACAAAKTDFSDTLEEYGIECKPILLNDSSFDTWITSLQPDIVVYDRYVIEEQYGWRVQKYCPKAMTILDTEDLHTLRYARKQAIKKGQEFTTEQLYSDTALREIASILRCDLSLIISEIEMDFLQSQFKIDADLLFYLPFLENYIPVEKTHSWIPFENRTDFIFMGNFLHQPNVDTVMTLKKHIWPTLKNQQPLASLHIYGAYISQQIAQLHQSKDRFYIMGRAENARETFSRYKVLLAPITFGAGIKGKFIDAMQSGTPSITTSIGAEGMCKDSSWCGSITNNWSEFIKQASTIYSNKNMWLAAQENGRQIINSKFDKTLYQISLLNAINTILHQLDSHRNKNFIGKILRHHSLQSTKYMSLWIEEKNKNQLQKKRP